MTMLTRLSELGLQKPLLDVNVPFDILFNVFNDIFEAKPLPFQDPVALTLLISDIEYLVAKWMDYFLKPTTSPFERANFPTRIINESLRKCLSAVPPGEIELVEKLKRLEHQTLEMRHVSGHY